MVHALSSPCMAHAFYPFLKILALFFVNPQHLAFICVFLIYFINKSNRFKQMDGEKFFYMVEFTLPQLIGERFQKLIPYQRAKVNTYFNEGKLASYTLSMENSKLWAIFIATSEREVEEFLHHLPLSRYMKHKINVLTFHHVQPDKVPAFSMN